VDIKVTRNDDDIVSLGNQMSKQNTINTEVLNRIDVFENEMRSVSQDVARLKELAAISSSANVPSASIPTSIHSSTVRPNVSSISFSQSASVPVFMSNSINPVHNISVSEPFRSTFRGSSEHIHKTVSEFSGQINVLHPESFLRQLDAFLENAPMSPTQQLISAQRRLIGDARVWYESLIPTPQTYHEFCILFRQRFWSDATQRKVRDDVLRPFSYNYYTGLTTHAMSWIASVKYLSPSFDQRDLVSIIIQHFPESISVALRGQGPNTTNELLSILTEFDESATAREGWP